MKCFAGCQDTEHQQCCHTDSQRNIHRQAATDGHCQETAENHQCDYGIETHLTGFTKVIEGCCTHPGIP